MSVPMRFLFNLTSGSAFSTIANTVKQTPSSYTIPIGIAAFMTAGMYFWGYEFISRIYSRVTSYREGRKTHQTAKKYNLLYESLQQQRIHLQQAWKTLCLEHGEFYETFKKHSYTASKRYLEILFDKFLDIDVPMDSILRSLKEITIQYETGDARARSIADASFAHSIEEKLNSLMEPAIKLQVLCCQLATEIAKENQDRQAEMMVENQKLNTQSEQVLEIIAKMKEPEAKNQTELLLENNLVTVWTPSFFGYQNSVSSVILSLRTFPLMKTEAFVSEVAIQPSQSEGCLIQKESVLNRDQVSTICH